MLGKQYLTRQVETLLRLAKAVSSPEQAAGLLEKVADLKSQLDRASTGPEDWSPPDVQAELPSQAPRTPKAIELIIEGYLRLNDRPALEALRKHREQLATNLREKGGWFDYSASIRQIEDDLAIIEVGLARLDSKGEA